MTVEFHIKGANYFIDPFGIILQIESLQALVDQQARELNDHKVIDQ